MLSDPLMLRETREAPDVAERLIAPDLSGLAAAIAAHDPAFVMTVARGSSDHAATYLKYAFETRLGLPVASAAPSMTTVYGARLKLASALVIAISQSGASPDVVRSVEAARRAGALTVALVNDETSPLAGAAEFVVGLSAGPERAVAATKSFVASLVVTARLVAQLTRDEDLRAALRGLPTVLRAALDLEAVARDRAERYRFAEATTVLGRGPHFGVALEAALKLKETSGLHAEGFSAAEFAHGPQRVVERGYPILAFTARDASAPFTLETLRALEERGAELLLIGEDEALSAPVRLVTPRAGDALLDPVVSVVALYLLAGHLSLARGENPDAPPGLRKVTKTH